MTSVGTRIRTALALGPRNLARVLSYRVMLRAGIPRFRSRRPLPAVGPFFRAPAETGPRAGTARVRRWRDTAILFSHLRVPLGDTSPDWLRNPLSSGRLPEPLAPWWEISDFTPEMGDIKGVWELSRMEWLLAFAQRARQGDSEALETVNAWLGDWMQRNPAYFGPNWKCGQEAGIRVMHLAASSLILGQVEAPQPAVQEFLLQHLHRIASTLQYALAQDNNHGTSEAAALFIGGSWLERLGEARGRRWARTGRCILEERVGRLVGAAGSFSQYSVNYHRLFLDTFCLVEVWRRRLVLSEFSAACTTRVRAAGEWLRHMVDPATGDAPNLGPNDGARLMPLGETVYRDFRPTVQLATALFSGVAAYGGDGSWNDGLRWLEVPIPDNVIAPPGTYVANDGGFAVLRVREVMGVLRYPRFTFRPSQADALHLDVWIAGANVLRDAGTFSYNSGEKWLEYFSGVQGHNTIQFDGREQMPRLGRFLFGDWLATDWQAPLQESDASVHFGAGYTDRSGKRHRRSVTVTGREVAVCDEVSGFRQRATLRWRMEPGNWECTREDERTMTVRATNLPYTLRVRSSVPMARCELVEGWESRHYMEKTPLAVLEIDIEAAGTLETALTWGAE